MERAQAPEPAAGPDEEPVEPVEEPGPPSETASTEPRSDGTQEQAPVGRPATQAALSVAADTPPAPLAAPAGLLILSKPAVRAQEASGTAHVETQAATRGAPSQPAGALPVQPAPSAASSAPAAASEPAAPQPRFDAAPAPPPHATPETVQPALPAGAGHEGAQRSEPGARVEVPVAPAPATEPLVPRAAEILRQMRLQLSPHLRQATLHLEPQALGPIELRVVVSGGKASAELRVESEATFAVLQRHVPELRAVLEQSGLGGGELSLFWQEPRHQDDPSGKRPGSTDPTRRGEGVAAPAAQLVELARAAAGAGGIDTYA